MPAPPTEHKGDEAAAEWVGRCISTRQHEHPDEDTGQSYIICARIYEESTGVKITRGGKE